MNMVLYAVLLVGYLAPLPKHIPAAAPMLRGDYVEARTASVFAGACHYNGELMTTGRDAIMAWDFSAGSYKGVDLTGVKAVAVVSSQANLGDDSAPRVSEITVDSSATPAQAEAVIAVLKSHCQAALGNIAAIHRASVSFEDQDHQYTVNAAGLASIQTQPMPNDECCKQPGLVWYSPLMPLEHRKVGYTVNAAYTAGTITDVWQRSGENDAIYGSFSFESR